MPRNWIKLLQRIGTRSHSATSSNSPYQLGGDEVADLTSPVSGKIKHPTWLIPAYLRQHRSGDRTYL